MADSDRNQTGGAGSPTQGTQSSVLALFLLMATAAGVLNLSPGKPSGSPTGSDAAKKAALGSANALPGPSAKASVADAIEALEPLQRFVNLASQPQSLDDYAGALKGYRVTTLIATLSDPKDSRLGYDFDMSLEAIQRAVESEGYSLDRFRLPWVDDSPTSSGPAPTPVSPPGRTTAAPNPGVGTASAAVVTTAASTGTGSQTVAARGPRHERQPGTILYRIDRKPGTSAEPDPPQDLLLLLLVGETPTWGIQHEALLTSLNIASALDYRPNSTRLDQDREPAIRILGPTFSGSADSLSRGIKTWVEVAEDRKDVRIWVCSGAATAVAKADFEKLCQPANVTYSATVIPDQILLRAVYRYLASPSLRRPKPNAPTMPDGTIALLVEGGSGYGAAVAKDYGTNASNDVDRRIISIPFPNQISQIRIGQANQETNSTKGRTTIPLDPPLGRLSDHIPSLSPQMTVATDSLLLTDILETISVEEVHYVGIVATDILDVMFLTKLIRDNCPDVQIFLIGNDLRYTDPQFTLDFRGTIIASSYPLDSRAQVWSFPFKGNTVRRLFASEYDIGRYNAGLVLLNARPDPEHDRRLLVEPDQAEDLIGYGKPFAATAFDSFNRRPQIWINQVGQDDLWPLKVVSINRISAENRKLAEDLIPAVVSLDPQQDQKPNYRVPYDFPLGWKITVVALSLMGFALVGMIVYSNLVARDSGKRRSSWFASSLKSFQAADGTFVERHWFFLTLLDLTLLLPYCSVIAPLDMLLSTRGMEEAEGSDLAALDLEPHVYLLAVMSWVTLFVLLVPPILASIMLWKARRSGRMSHVDVAERRKRRWSRVERGGYFFLTFAAAAVALGAVVDRFVRFTITQFQMPNDWLVRERGVHLFSGVSPIIPALFLGAAFAWWVYLELGRFDSHPLLRNGDDLVDMHLGVSHEGRGWAKVVAEMNARFRHSVRLLDEPLTALISENLPLAGVSITATAVLTIFIWGVIWPRYIATPDGPTFDLLFMLAFTTYLTIQLYALLRFIWLWRSINQLFRQLAVLPIATVFDRMPPVVGEIFGRFLSAMRLTSEDLKIPLQQCRLLMAPDPDSDLPAKSHEVRVVALPLIEAGRPAPEIFEAVARVCVPPVLENIWNRRSLDNAYGTQEAETAKPAISAEGFEASPAIDLAGRRWLAMAEELVALRIVYLVSQFSASIGIIARQLIFGPLFLLLAATWYPFQPQRLIAIVIWCGIIIGGLATFIVFVRIERNEFVNRVSRTAPNSFFFDRAFLTNLAPYAVPIIGFLLTAFPSLSYWLGSVIEPITRAVK